MYAIRSYYEGYITFRWIGAADYPVPVCEQLPRAALADYLPAQVRTIGPEGRRQQLAARRSGIIRRFGHY